MGKTSIFCAFVCYCFPNIMANPSNKIQRKRKKEQKMREREQMNLQAKQNKSHMNLNTEYAAMGDLLNKRAQNQAEDVNTSTPSSSVYPNT
ncbi:hypothetical protein DFH27DRAFT_253189 [Peziza echinospora]|nr:hypothetical protein DFH27DRAFT_253189 [Peziza echinospora]